MTALTPGYGTPWSAEEDTELRRLHALVPALSYTQIAAHIGRKRNACIGRSHRLDLPDRSAFRSHNRLAGGSAAHKSGPKPGGTRRGPVSPSRLFNAGLRQPPAPGLSAAKSPRLVRVVLADGSDGCRWPTGDNPFVFCAAVVDKDQVYCGEHCRLAYRPRRAG